MAGSWHTHTLLSQRTRASRQFRINRRKRAASRTIFGQVGLELLRRLRNVPLADDVVAVEDRALGHCHRMLETLPKASD